MKPSPFLVCLAFGRSLSRGGEAGRSHLGLRAVATCPAVIAGVWLPAAAGGARPRQRRQDGRVLGLDSLAAPDVVARRLTMVTLFLVHTQSSCLRSNLVLVAIN